MTHRNNRNTDYGLDHNIASLHADMDRADRPIQ